MFSKSKDILDTYHRTGNTGFERRVDFLLQQFLKIYVLFKEWMFFNLLSTPHSKSLGGVSREEASKNATCLGTDLRSENKRIVENLLIHLFSVLCNDL
jgi:hypothetical protein